MTTTTSSRARRAARAEALRKEQQRRRRRRSAARIIAVVASLAVVVTLGFLVTRARDTTRDVTAAPAAARYGVTLGPADAPHTVVVYEDFLCPYCGALEATTRATFGELAEDGRVRVDYRPFELLGYVSDYSRRAATVFAVVLDRSGSAVALRLHDALFQHQPSEAGPFPDANDLVAMAVAAGADRQEVLDGLADGTGDAWVDRANRAAAKAGVRSTPTVLLDGEVFTDGRTMQDLADNLVAEVE